MISEVFLIILFSYVLGSIPSGVILATFVVPVFPDPIFLISSSAKNLASITPEGIEPKI